MSYPNNLHYTKEHEWISLEKDSNIATVGITSFAQKELGDIVYVDVNTVGKQLRKDEIFGSIEAVKTVSDLYLPVSGKILQSNPKLESNPELVNSDPYGEGWIIKLEVDNKGDVQELMSSTDYEKIVG